MAKNLGSGANSSSDSRSLFKQSGISGVGRFVRIFLNYVQAIILTNFLGTSQFGIYVLARNTTQVFSLFGGLGLGPTLTRIIPSGSKDSGSRIDRITKYSLVASLTFSTLIAIALFLLSDVLAVKLFKQEELAEALRWFSLSIPIQSLVLVAYGILRGHKLISARVLSESLLFPLTSISLILLFSWAKPGLAAVILACIFAHLSTLFFSGYVINRFTQLSSKWLSLGSIQKLEQQEVNSFALPLLLSSSADYLQMWADTFMLGILSTSASVGIYAISMRVGSFIQIPLTAFNLVFAPMISEISSLGDSERLARNYKLVTRMVLVLSLPIFGIVVLAPLQILSVFGDAFSENHEALVLICFGQLINVSVGSTGQMLVMTGRAKLHLLNSIIFLLLTVTLNWLLIPEFGIIGAAIANMVTLGLLNLMRVIQIYLDLRIHPFSSGLLKTMGIASVTLGLAVYITHYVFALNGWGGAIVKVAIFTSTYGALIVGFALGFEEKELLRTIFQKLSIKKNE